MNKSGLIARISDIGIRIHSAEAKLPNSQRVLLNGNTFARRTKNNVRFSGQAEFLRCVSLRKKLSDLDAYGRFRDLLRTRCDHRNKDFVQEHFFFNANKIEHLLRITLHIPAEWRDIILIELLRFTLPLVKQKASYFAWHSDTKAQIEFLLNLIVNYKTMPRAVAVDLKPGGDGGDMPDPKKRRATKPKTAKGKAKSAPKKSAKGKAKAKSNAKKSVKKHVQGAEEKNDEQEKEDAENDGATPQATNKAEGSDKEHEKPEDEDDADEDGKDDQDDLQHEQNAAENAPDKKGAGDGPQPQVLKITAIE